MRKSFTGKGLPAATGRFGTSGRGDGVVNTTIEEVEAPDLTFDFMLAEETMKHPPCESGNHINAPHS